LFHGATGERCGAWLGDRNWVFPQSHTPSAVISAVLPSRGEHRVQWDRAADGSTATQVSTVGAPCVLSTVFRAHLMKVVRLVLHWRTWLSFHVQQLLHFHHLFFCAGERINWVYTSVGWTSRFVGYRPRRIWVRFTKIGKCTIQWLIFCITTFTKIINKHL